MDSRDPSVVLRLVLPDIDVSPALLDMIAERRDRL